ncbi:MAG: hypothetical protein ACQEXN_05960 [Actinomycetota bacterium]
MKKLSAAVVLIALATGAAACSAGRMTVDDSCEEIKAITVEMATGVQAFAMSEPDDESVKSYLAEAADKYRSLSERVAEPLEAPLQAVSDNIENPDAENEAAGDQILEICPSLSQ